MRKSSRYNKVAGSWRRAMATCCLAAVAVLAVLWAASERREFGWGWLSLRPVGVGSHQTAGAICSRRGSLSFCLQRDIETAELRAAYGQGAPMRAYQSSWYSSRYEGKPFPRPELLGFWLRYEPRSGGTRGYDLEVQIPYWAWIAVFSWLPLRMAIRTARRTLRIRRGQCPVCGYDLRGIRDRCPECGIPFDNAASGSAARPTD